MDDFREMLDEFKKSCRRAIQSEVDRGTDPDAMSKKEKKAWKSRVLSCILTDFPYLDKAMSEWTACMNGAKDPTPRAHLGHRAMGIWGNACQYYDKPSGDVQSGRVPLSNDSIADRYRQLCVSAAKGRFLVPADNPLAIICGCTSGAFGNARTKMKKEGWVFDCEEYPGTTWKSYYVTSPPEPEKSVPLLNDEDRLLLRKVAILLERVDLTEKN